MISADRHLERWIVHHRTGWLNPVFEGLSWAGRLGLLWIALALVLSVLWRRWGVLFMTLFAVAVADWASMGLKALVDRPRPPLRYAQPKVLVPLPHDASFPSGHAATSFAAATILSFAAPRLAPFLFLLAAAIAFSRVYVGVHYPLDVIGGAVLGVLVGLGVRYLISRARRASSLAAAG
ncbi:MAG: phosphatase PAP2 family protein [Actinobacteria bacterium]|nr:MAG: phosphatase PAP2 family protein [Actinomycetota bacterium]